MSLAKLIKDACHDKSKNTLVFTPDTLTNTLEYHFSIKIAY